MMSRLPTRTDTSGFLLLISDVQLYCIINPRYNIHTNFVNQKVYLTLQFNCHSDALYKHISLNGYDFHCFNTSWLACVYLGIDNTYDDVAILYEYRTHHYLVIG